MKIIYIVYILFFRTPFKKIHALALYNGAKKRYSVPQVYQKMFRDLFKHDAIPIDFFYFDFISKTDQDKQKYTSRYWMYRYHQKMNAPQFTSIFSDKIIFHQYFKDFITHDHFAVRKNDTKLFIDWLNKKYKSHLIGKNSKGAGGSNIKKFKIEKRDGAWLIDKKPPAKFLASLSAWKIDLLEECIIQHQDLNHFFPDSINTIRIITILNNEGKVGILGAMLRIGVDCVADNFSMGGVATSIDLQTGTTGSQIFFKDPSKKLKDNLHPVTGVVISGQKIPFWEQCLKMVRKASKVVPQVRTVGWDVAITPVGPTFVEGNHNWNHHIPQITLQRGLKEDIQRLTNLGSDTVN